MLSEVPKGWQRQRLTQCFDVKSSKRVLQKQWRKQGIPFYRGREITALSEHGSVDNELFIDEELYRTFAEKSGVPSKGDILITAIGTIGNTYCVRESEEFYFKDASVLWLSKKADANSLFINYWLNSASFKNQLDSGNGTTVDSLTIKQLSNSYLLIPPLTEQKRIADVLSSVDESIQATQRLIEQAERVKQGLMEELLTGGLGSEAIEGGEVPEAWLSKTLADICEIARGGSPRPIDSYITDEPDGINWIKIGDASASSKYIYKTKQKIKKEGVAKSRTVSSGDFLLSNSMSFGKPYILRLNGCIHDGWLSLTMNRRMIIEEYLYYLLSSRVVKAQFSSKASGSAVKNLNKQLVGAVKVAIPNLVKQKEISELLSKLDEQVELYKSNLGQLADTKKGLMDDLLTGKVRTV